MTLLRAVARTMLASYFISNGVKAARKPAEFAADAEPVANKVVPLVKQYAPAQVASYIPEDTQTLVRITGITQLVGGLALASGKGRRLGATLLAVSLVPTTLARHPFWCKSDPDEKAAEKSHFLKNVALLGGVILAARDTEGQPGLAWRTSAGVHALAHGGSHLSHKASKAISKNAKALRENVSGAADSVTSSGAALASQAGKQSRRARRKAKKRAKKAQKQAGKLSAQVQKRAKQRAKEAQKKGKKAAQKGKKAANQAANK